MSKLVDAVVLTTGRLQECVDFLTAEKLLPLLRSLPSHRFFGRCFQSQLKTADALLHQFGIQRILEEDFNPDDFIPHRVDGPSLRQLPPQSLEIRVTKGLHKSRATEDLNDFLVRAVVVPPRSSRKLARIDPVLLALQERVD